MRRPKIYLIQCHRGGANVSFLLEAIFNDHDIFAFFFDKKASDTLVGWARAIAERHPNVWVFKPEYVSWAGFTQVSSFLNTMEAALKLDSAWSHIITLSVDHLPLRNSKEISAKIADGISYVAAWPADFVNTSPRSIELASRFSQIYRELSGVGPFAVAERPGESFYKLVIHAGSNWVVLSRDCCEVLVEIKNSGSLFKFFETTVAADEVAIPTIINGLKCVPSDKIVNMASTFVSSPWNGGDHSMQFSDEQFFLAGNEGYSFIRKRPLQLSPEVSSYIETLISLPRVRFPYPEEARQPTRTSIVRIEEELIALVQRVFPDLVPESFGGSDVISPKLYIRYLLPKRDPHPQLFVAVLSEDLIEFKVLLGFHDVFDGLYQKWTIGGLRTTVIKARVHGLAHHREIHLDMDKKGGFVQLKVAEPLSTLAGVLLFYCQSGLWLLEANSALESG